MKILFMCFLVYWFFPGPIVVEAETHIFLYFFLTSGGRRKSLFCNRPMGSQILGGTLEDPTNLPLEPRRAPQSPRREPPHLGSELQAIFVGEAWDAPRMATLQNVILRWHLCRTKLPRRVFNSKTKYETKSETKSSKNAPRRPRKFCSAA